MEVFATYNFELVSGNTIPGEEITFSQLSDSTAPWDLTGASFCWQIKFPNDDTLVKEFEFTPIDLENGKIRRNELNVNFSPANYVHEFTIILPGGRTRTICRGRLKIFEKIASCQTSN